MRIFFLLATSWAVLQAQTPAVKQIQFEGSPAIALSNDKLELTVTLLGGSFARLILRDDPGALNPLWEPVRMARELGQTSQFRGGTGHFVCVDGFGPVSREEGSAGLPGHGEAHLETYHLTEPATLEAELPIVHEKFTRALRMVDGENVVYVSSRLENLLGFDRPVNWAEHATIGSPFLQSGATVVDVSGSRSLTRPYERGDQDQRLTSGKEFVWPIAPGLQGNVDLRGTPSQPHFIDHAATLVDPARKYGWVTALNTEKHLLIGWVFRSAEYPWVQYWGHYPATCNLRRPLGPAYSGRSVDHHTQPRYRVPPGFPKSEVLFNMHRAAAEAYNSVVVVEGFFDCMKVHQAGIRSVVALMGSALYEPQRQILLQRFRRVILLLDGDRLT